MHFNHKKLVDLRLLAKFIEDTGDNLKNVSDIIFNLHEFIQDIEMNEYLINYFTVLHKIYDELLSISTNNEFSIIRLRNVINIDLSIIQIIVSLTKSLNQMNKEITIHSHFEQQFDELFKNTEVYNIFESISKK